MDTSISGSDTWFILNGEPLIFSSADENLDAKVTECNSSSRRGSIIRVTPNIPSPEVKFSCEGEDIESAYLGIWEWRPPLGFAGLCELHCTVAGYSPLIAKVRVFPEKLTQDRYEGMLTDLQGIAVDLLIRLNSWSSEKAILQLRETTVSPLREYLLLKKIIHTMEDVVYHIHRDPHRRLGAQRKQKLLHEVRLFSHATIPVPGETVSLPAGVSASLGHAQLPTSWIVPESKPTYDVYENRLLKHFLRHQLTSKLFFVQKRAEEDCLRLEKDLMVAIANHWNTDRLETEIKKLKEAVADCKRMMKQCILWADKHFLKTVKTSNISGKATQVLLKSPSYGRFFQLYLHFQQELSVSLKSHNSVTDLAMRKVCDLYEVWCVFTVTQMIVEELVQAHYAIASNALFFEIERNQFEFTVRKNDPSIILRRGNVKVQIIYEPLYKSKKYLSSAAPATIAVHTDDKDQLTPDMAVEIYKDGEPIGLIIFDAKYKWGGLDGSRTPNRDDKNKMREYRDNICSIKSGPTHTTPIQRIVSNAYILYPGDALWQEPLNKVGAIPLIPNMSEDQKRDAANVIRSLLQAASLL
ncbi:DUF2357 domain-containing protein [Ktedonobacter racemifer]|uniref:DUF2357 domain-containing protein n=1 Tax=Ktedonobacter racemifer DSM 44963 TaxID=485913 RepID=D6TPM6_KTERA|nr:DUF2357 domain-containing protein [Ktedonobacter racemifer]EFH85640.1 protein of unknown function DUF524 [Ktedonobacter racemifer DSM 44963]